MIVFIYENITSEEAKSKSIDFYEKVTKTSLGKLSKTEKGKPVLDYGFISVSHTKNIVCVAISEKEIGIDIESKTREIKLPNMTIKRWTEVEAYAKWRGSGIEKDKIYLDIPKLWLHEIFALKDYYISVYSEDGEIFVK